MKKLIYLLLLLFCMVACSKTDIVPKIDTIPNYYKITNDSNDPVQAKRYELFEKYNVPVFFNDTIAKVFVDISAKGDSIFRYERVDMNWGFYNNTVSTFRYDYTYFTTEKEKLDALNIAEKYLESASKELRPFCMLLTKTASKIDIKSAANVLYDNFEVGYRALLLHNFLRNNTESLIDAFVYTLKKQMITVRISNFINELEAFNQVSDATWYGKTFITPKDKGGLGVVWDSSRTLMRYFAGRDTLVPEKIELTAMRISYDYYQRDYPNENETCFDSLRQNPRDKIGTFGFVGTHKQNSMAAYPKSQELSIFLDEILTTNKEVFESRWGKSPLVMAKYEIMYGIIKEKLGVEL